MCEHVLYSKSTQLSECVHAALPICLKHKGLTGNLDFIFFTNMKFVAEACLLLYIITILTSETLSEYTDKSAQNDKCPLTCWCKTSSYNNNTGWKVTCNKRYRYWEKVPPLPYNTVHLDMVAMPNMIIRKGSFTKMEGKTLRIFLLKYSTGTVALESGAFR